MNIRRATETVPFQRTNCSSVELFKRKPSKVPSLLLAIRLGVCDSPCSEAGLDSILLAHLLRRCRVLGPHSAWPSCLPLSGSRVFSWTVPVAVCEMSLFLFYECLVLSRDPKLHWARHQLSYLQHQAHCPAWQRRCSINTKYINEY